MRIAERAVIVVIADEAAIVDGQARLARRHRRFERKPDEPQVAKTTVTGTFLAAASRLALSTSRPSALSHTTLVASARLKSMLISPANVRSPGTSVSVAS